jgi:endogenous inhibitor of DNA gyrase (YacG/DUF329 family)
MGASVKCPICGKPVPFDDPNMPFCSDRCRLLDLGNWASEKYAVPGNQRGNELEETDEPLPSPQQGRDR